MGRMITEKEIENEFGVPAHVVHWAVQSGKIEHQVMDGLISIDMQDAEKIIFEYHAKLDSYSWRDVAEKFNVARSNKSLRRLIDSILPHYDLTCGTYYPASDVEEVLADKEHYPIKKYKDNYYYMEGSREDYYITNYFTLEDFRQEFEREYNMELKLRNFSDIKGQLKKEYPVETVNLFGFKECILPLDCMEQLIEDYYRFYTVDCEKDPYARYEKEAMYSGGRKEIGQTLKLYDEFAHSQISKTKNQSEKTMTLVALKKVLNSTLDKEIYQYENDEICNLLRSIKAGRRENIELCLFLKYILNKCGENCAFDVALSPKNAKKVKAEQDFYTEDEWLKYINFIFDIDLHIEKAFSNPLYAKYWLYCMLQCSLAWRKEDILDIPSLNMQDVGQYSVEWFEQNEFTRAMAWAVVNAAKNFIEQDRVNKTGARKHFIILNSFVIATAIGFIICEKHRQESGASGLFGKFTFNYGVMVRQLGTEIEGFSNLKATRTILSFANETASNMDYSSQAISIASYMRSHIAGADGLSDMTVTYLKSSFDERELLSLPARMGEIGLFGWLYKEMLTAADEEPQRGTEKLIGTIREDLTPLMLEEYAEYLVQDQKKRAEIVKEILECQTEDLKDLCAELESGKCQSKKEDIYCIKTSCCHPTSKACELCEYAIPSIHALHIVGQEASGLLDRLLSGQGTARDKERYSYQLLKLLTILKEAKQEFGKDFVDSFADYGIISEKLKQLQNSEKGE